MSVRRPSWSRLLLAYVAVLVIPVGGSALTLVVAYLLTAHWPQIGVVVYVFVIALSLAVFVFMQVLLYRLPPLEKALNSSYSLSGRLLGVARSLRVMVIIVWPGLIGYGGGVVIGFGQLFRSWQYQFGGFSAPAHAGYWEWAQYSLSWVLDNVLANAGQIFGWDVSPIHPVAPGAQTLVLVYNIMLELLVLAVVIRSFQVVTVAAYLQPDRLFGHPYERKAE